MTIARRVVQSLFGDYGCYKIFAYDLEKSVESSGLEPPLRFAEVSPGDVQNAKDEVIRNEAWYGGSDSRGFGIYRDDRLVCLQWFWYGERYKRRNFWPLEPGEAKSVQLVTVPSEQGQGLATKLKQWSAYRMKQAGFSRLYSRIWYTHRSSIRVSEKAGWKHVATVVKIYPFGGSRSWSLGSREWRRRVSRKVVN